jgi:hypothetical protein
MKQIYRISLFLTALLFLTVGVASADSLISYTFTGAVSASFDLPVNPTVIDFTLGHGFEVQPINLMLNGVASSDTLVFYSAAFGGAFAAFSCDSCADLNLAGPQLYSGSEATPTMLLLNGVPLTDFDSGAPAGSISTPEPSALALLSAGLSAMLALALVSGAPRSRLPVVAR